MKSHQDHPCPCLHPTASPGPGQPPTSPSVPSLPWCPQTAMVSILPIASVFLSSLLFLFLADW